MGIKRREPKSVIPNSVDTNSPEWKAGFEKYSNSADNEDKTPIALDPEAKRDFKAIQFNFNQYEFERVEEARIAARRTRVSFIRTAMLKLADELLGDKK